MDSAVQHSTMLLTTTEGTALNFSTFSTTEASPGSATLSPLKVRTVEESEKEEGRGEDSQTLRPVASACRASTVPVLPGTKQNRRKPEEGASALCGRFAAVT